MAGQFQDDAAMCVGGWQAAQVLNEEKKPGTKMYSGKRLWIHERFLVERLYLCVWKIVSLDSFRTCTFSEFHFLT